MDYRKANMELLSKIPDAYQEEIHEYLLQNFGEDSPFKPMSKQEILAELAESRACYERGEYQNFDEVLDEISKEYGLQLIRKPSEPPVLTKEEIEELEKAEKMPFIYDEDCPPMTEEMLKQDRKR